MKKTVKIIVAAAMLACVTAAFFGFGTDLACRIQPAATVWFLAVLLLTPLFVTFQKLHMYNTFFAVILPSAALQLPFAILLTRNYDTGIPDALIEAARIDGASPVKVFWYVILPLARPIASSVTMLTLINAWNAYLLPLLFLQSPKLQTVTLLPQFFQGEFTNDQTKILAAAVLTAVPEIIAYLCMQKSFEKGMSAGALK